MILAFDVLGVHRRQNQAYLWCHNISCRGRSAHGTGRSSLQPIHDDNALSRCCCGYLRVRLCARVRARACARVRARAGVRVLVRVGVGAWVRLRADTSMAWLLDGTSRATAIAVALSQVGSFHVVSAV